MILSVKVRAGASKDAVEDNDPLTIYVKEKAENNKANVAVVKLLAEHFSVPSSSIRIVKGHASSRKVIEITSSSFQRLKGLKPQ
ncbi:MAG: DUF167 domain-containing protein [Candidatus Anstonellales archaeon]